MRHLFRELGDFELAVFEGVAEHRASETRALRAGAESGAAKTRALRAETGTSKLRAVALRREEAFHFFGGQEAVAVFIGGLHLVFALLRHLFRELGDFELAVFEGLAETRASETRALRAGAAVLSGCEGRGRSQQGGEKDRLFHLSFP